MIYYKNDIFNRQEYAMESFSVLNGFAGDFSDNGLPYRIKLPENCDNGKNHPLILFLHGAYSRGTDNRAQLYLPELFEKSPLCAENSPILLAPQCPVSDSWGPRTADDVQHYRFQKEPSPATAEVLNLLDRVLEKYPVDFERIYLVGASMGGYGAWDLLIRRPNFFAAALIFCGGGDPSKLGAIARIPVSLWYMSHDPTVPPRNSKRMAAALHELGGNPVITEIPGNSHDVWTPALSSLRPQEWLFQQKQLIPASRPRKTGEVVKFSAHGFDAEIAPEAGGNLYRLYHAASKLEMLRKPHRLDELYHSCVCFGMPVLCPPNRIANGRFTFRGRECRLPITDAKGGNHLHGLANNQTWNVLEQTDGSVTLFWKFTPSDPRFAGFPYQFELRRTYRLTPEGLTDTMTALNSGTETMPFGLGYHTAFPARNAMVRVGVGDCFLEIEPEHILPTGKKIPWTDFNPSTPFSPFGLDIGFHAPAGMLDDVSGGVFRGAELKYPHGTVRYLLDEKFKFWYTWNCGGYNDFLCLEPVSWVSNALNIGWNREESNLIELEPGQTITFTNRLLKL